MKNYKIIIALICLKLVVSCEIVQETTFEPDGSGKYSLGFDLSEMLKMGSKSKSSSNKQLDTLIVFSDFIEAQKDSISNLSKKDRKKINQLKEFSLYIKADSVSQKMQMRINYNFKNSKDLKLFGEKLKGQSIKELELFTNKIQNEEKDADFLNLNTLFDTKFSKRSFSVKLNKEALKDAKKEKMMTDNNPMADMIRFKTKYIFPYKIKKLSNNNARILPNFKGVEISANLFDMNNNPQYFDIEIEFEKK